MIQSKYYSALLKTPPDNGGMLYDHGDRIYVQKVSSLFLLPFVSLLTWHSTNSST